MLVLPDVASARSLPSHPMKHALKTALAALVLVSIACQGDPSAPKATRGAGNSTMSFELASLDGGRISPGDSGEIITLVDFWATWCGPCHLQADILATLYPEFRDKGVEFLAVSLGEPEALVREFVADRPFSYPVLVDPADTIAPSYGLFVLPTVVLLDRDGTILYQREGISTAQRLRSAINEILQGRSGGDELSEEARTAS